MKKAFILALAIATMVGACKKDNTVPTPDLAEQREAGMEGEAPPLMDCDSALNQITLENGMLKISSWGAYYSVQACLEAQYEAHNDAFEAQWAQLSDDEFNDKAEALAFDEDQPLKDFEQRMGFTSLRAVIERQTDEWLDHEVLDQDADPDDHDSDDNIMRTLLNADGKIMIGDEVFDSQTGEMRDDQCVLWRRKADWPQYDNGTKKYKCKIAIRNYPVVGLAFAKVKSFKKHGNGWKLFKTRLQIFNFGAFYHNECDYLGAFTSAYKDKRRKKLEVRFMVWNHSVKTQNGAIKGWYYCNGQNRILPLTW